MKKLIVSLFLFYNSCGPVYADRVDNILAGPDNDYCSVVAMYLEEGAKAMNNGFARKLSHPSPMVMEMAEHGIPLPRESMYITDWNSLTDNEKAFVQEHVFFGWDQAKNIGRPLGQEEIAKMKQALYEGCMYKRTEERVNKNKVF